MNINDLPKEVPTGHPIVDMYNLLPTLEAIFGCDIALSTYADTSGSFYIHCTSQTREDLKPSDNFLLRLEKEHGVSWLKRTSMHTPLIISFINFEKGLKGVCELLAFFNGTVKGDEQ